jgi:hypothetical protein
MSDTFDTDGNVVADPPRRVVVNQRRVGERVFISPYRNFPEIGEPHEIEVQLEPPPLPVLYATFDPSKPTIDQTRQAAIDAIRTNFQNLPMAVPGGGTTQVQFNDAGAFGGDAGLTYAKATDTLTVAGALAVPTITAQAVTINPGSLTVQGGGSGYFIGSAGVIAQAAGASKLEVRANSGTDAAYMTFHRPNSFAAYFGLDTDNTWRVGGYSYGAASYRLLHEANSFNLNTAGQLSTGLAIVSALTVLGAAVIGGYAWKGAWNGALDFRTAQTFGVGPASTITSMAGAGGQIVRILVAGGGSIAMPASVKWADGSPTWGTTYTLISGWTDGGGTFWMSTTPFST